MPMITLPLPPGTIQDFALGQAIVVCAAQGWRLQSATADTAEMTYRQGGDINHVLHAILSVLTAGAWLLVWLFLVVNKPQWHLLILADEAGKVSYRRSC